MTASLVLTVGNGRRSGVRVGEERRKIGRVSVGSLCTHSGKPPRLSCTNYGLSIEYSCDCRDQTRMEGTHYAITFTP